LTIKSAQHTWPSAISSQQSAQDPCFGLLAER